MTEQHTCVQPRSVRTPPQPTHKSELLKVSELREALRHTHFWAHPPHREWLTDRTLLRFLIAVRLVVQTHGDRGLSRPMSTFTLPLTQPTNTHVQREFNVDKALEMLHTALTWRGSRCVPSTNIYICTSPTTMDPQP